MHRTISFYARLLAVPFVLSLLDAAVTLMYQPAAYWQGDRSQLVEANPLVWVALRVHPLLLIPGFIGWYTIFFLLIFYAPAWIGLRCHVALVIGHLIGVAGWLLRHHEAGLLLTLVIATVSLTAAAWLFRPFRESWNSPRPLIWDLWPEPTGRAARTSDA